MNVIAPAKLNLCLYLGPGREDGLHELCSLFCPISLADHLEITEAAGDADEVICAGVEAPDLAARALMALREAGWRRPPLRIEVRKRIPVAAGLGGGSADAAAVLRLARDDFDPEELRRIGSRIGADVPSQVEPRFALVGGAGERVVPLPEPDPFWIVLLPDPEGLATAAVFAEADRLGLGRSVDELRGIRGDLLGAAAAGASPLAYPELLVNDLTAAARSLRPALEVPIGTLGEAEAEVVLMTGSGPTVAGLFGDESAARAAADEIGAPAIVASSGMMS